MLKMIIFVIVEELDQIVSAILTEAEPTRGRLDLTTITGEGGVRRAYEYLIK